MELYYRHDFSSAVMVILDDSSWPKLADVTNSFGRLLALNDTPEYNFFQCKV